MRESRATNRTQGRLEIHSYRLVLDPGEEVSLAHPITDEVMWLVGERKLSLKEVAQSGTAKKRESPISLVLSGSETSRGEDPTKDKKKK